MFLDITSAFDNVKWIPLLMDIDALIASSVSVRTVMSFLYGRTVSPTVEGCWMDKPLQKGCP